MKRSNLIPITKIYEIYPKYTYSEDVKKFMDEIVDIDRASVYTKDEVIAILQDLQKEMEENVLDDDPDSLLPFLQARETCVAVVHQKINELKGNASEMQLEVKNDIPLPKEYKMREATTEELESVNNYIKSISKPTGVNVWDEIEEADKTIKDEYNEAITELQRDINWSKLDQYPYIGKRKVKALQMAIKALEQEPCEDAISRQEVLVEINRIGIKAFETYNDYSQFFDFVDTLPPITPQQKNAHWVLYRDYENMIDYPQCNNCGTIIKLPLPIDNLNFCPNCGRKMEKKNESTCL